ncbi:autotransporter outer membrane beta-barrel domain-containing protein [Escherichia coli]|nr:autotransporter outer membrane beta-barrel domain-containing protein [Escherichia coli]EGM8679018.1 autotransporter outer membrane beta-barrel domain-containing protein [Escherichia coli]
MASQHINIHNSGVMSGNVTTAGDVNVMPGGTLRVAKTTIGGNLENGGTVQMNSEGGKPGNVLTVNGNYTGNNGLMTFNATLGGDNSPTDKMNVKGDTQGNTRVRVDNIGGVGAQTVNGIELIEVGGNSAGNFALTTGTSLVYTCAHNVYYVKSCLSDAKCFSGSRYSFRVQELKPLLFHNWPVHGEIAWLFPAPC